MNQCRNDKRENGIETVSLHFAETVEIPHEHRECEMERRQCAEDGKHDIA
jgi:hypothetical protein